MRISAPCMIAAVAFAAVSFTEGALIFANDAAVLALTPATVSDRFITNKLPFRSNIASRFASPSFHHHRASANNEAELDIETLQVRGIKDSEEMLLSDINKFVEDFDEVSENAGTQHMTSVNALLYGSRKRRMPAWANTKPELAHAVGLLRSKLPRIHRNGMPDIEALAAISPEQRFAFRYVDLRRRVENLAERERRGSIDRPSASFGPVPGSKHKLDKAGEEKLRAARALVESTSLPRYSDERLDAAKVSPEEVKAYRAAQRLVYNSKRRERYKARKLLAKSVPGGAATQNSQRIEATHAASSTSTNSLASASSTAVHHRNLAAPSPQVSLPDSTLMQPQTPTGSMAASPQRVHAPLSTVLQPNTSPTASSASQSSSPPPQPVPTFIEPSVPVRESAPTPPRIPSPMHHWSSFGSPIYSPPRFFPW